MFRFPGFLTGLPSLEVSFGHWVGLWVIKSGFYMYPIGGFFRWPGRGFWVEVGAPTSYRAPWVNRSLMCDCGLRLPLARRQTSDMQIEGDIHVLSLSHPFNRHGHSQGTAFGKGF